MKKSLKYLLIAMLMLFPTVVFAAGSAKCDISGSSSSTTTSTSATLGSNVTIYVRVNSLNGNSIVSAGGDINYDTSYLEYVSAQNLTDWSNNSRKVRDGLYRNNVMDNSMENPITSDKATYSVTFKTLKEGSTTVTFSGVEIANSSEILNSSSSNKTVTINISNGSSTDQKSNNANLSGITVSKGTLSPAFNKDTTGYTVNVENSVNSISIGATKEDTKANMTGDTGTKSLSEGNNIFSIKVTAEDGTTSKTYTIKVVRATSGGEPSGGDEGGDPTPGEGEGEPEGPSIDDPRSSDNKLKNLSVSGYTLNPGFSPNQDSYSIEVNNDVNKIDVTALPNHEKATASIEGNTDLKVGINNVTVKVTAEDGSQKIYTIKVVKKGENNTTPTDITSKSSENRLKSLFIANGTLSTKFDPNINNYSIVVANEINSLDLSAIAMDSKATVRVYNNEGFTEGETKVVSIVVTAENGSQRTYTINVKKSDKTSNNKLVGISIGGTSLEPGFNKDITNYTAKVGSGVKSINVSATPENENAKVEYSVNGGAFSSNGNLNLEDGNNVVLVKVTDENGFVQFYTVNVEKKPSTFSIFGLKIPRWLGYLLLGLLLLFIGWLIFLVLRRRKQKDVERTQAVPNIEFKPEFNFGSKNQDNDKVEDGGILNQNSAGASASSEDNDGNNNYDAFKDDEKEVPYDPYDEVVTKDEIIDAIQENDPEKLKILYKQEMLNREKEKIKNKENEEIRHSKKDDE